MASSRCRARLPRGVSEAVVGPAARDEVAHVVAHADLVGPRLGHLVERALLGGVHAELAAVAVAERGVVEVEKGPDRKSTRLNSSHTVISYAVFCLKKKR